MTSMALAMYYLTLHFVLFAHSEGKNMIQNDNPVLKDKVHNSHHVFWQLAILIYPWTKTSVGQSQIVTKAVPPILGAYLSLILQSPALIRMGGWTSVLSCRTLDQRARNYLTGWEVMRMKVIG